MLKLPIFSDASIINLVTKTAPFVQNYSYFFKVSTFKKIYL